MPTLSSTLILQKTLAAFRTQFPMLQRMGTSFDDSPLRLNDQVIAHIRTLPSAATFDSSTGYANGATSARSLLVDVPITVSEHQHVPVKFEHLNLIKDQKDVYDGCIADQAFVLGRTMIDSVLAKCKSSNISNSSTEAVANVDLETLEGINSTMNLNGASPVGRVGLISTLAAGQLALDTRIASRDYYGLLTGGNAYRVFRGVAGFDAVYEYPGLPSNNAATQTFTAATTDIITAAAHGFSNGDRVRVSSTTTLPAGLSASTTYYVRDATTNTFKLAATDGGTAIDITDTGTGTHSVVGYENIIGVFFEASSIAIRAGIPAQTSQLAAMLGIPQIMAMESLRDPATGFALALMKWQSAGTGDIYVSPTALWGSAVGRQAGTAGTITDKGAVLLRAA